jgi:hypothetical protein
MKTPRKKEIRKNREKMKGVVETRKSYRNGRDRDRGTKRKKYDN